jgi:hypothetical protein
VPTAAKSDIAGVATTCEGFQLNMDPKWWIRRWDESRLDGWLWHWRNDPQLMLSLWGG